MAEEVGSLAVKIGLDNTGFTTGISLVNKNLRVLNSEFKLNTSAIGANGTAMDKLKLKASSLAQSIDNQKMKVDILEKAYQKSVTAKGKDAKATQDLEIRMNIAKTALNNMKNTLETTNTAIETQGSKWKIYGDKLTSVGDKMKKFGDKVKGIGKTLSAAVTTPILAIGAGSIKLASDQNESLNKVDVAFKNNANEVKSWSDTTLQKFGIAKGSALDMASLFGDMASGMGINTSEAAKMSTNLGGLAGDLASFKNIGIDQAEEALKGIFTGEGDSLKQLGVVMTDATLKEYAHATGSKKSYDQMSQSEKVMLRYQYVLDKTKNSQGDFAKTSDGTANSSRVLAESVKELGANFGTILLPVVTPIIQKLSQLIQSFGKLSPETKKIILIIAGIVAVVGPVIVIVGTLISSIGAISGFVGGIGTAIANAGGLIAVLTGPIGIVIAIVVALVAVGVLLYTNWDIIKAKCAQLAKDIPIKFHELVTGAVAKIVELKDKIVAKFIEINLAMAQKVIDMVKTVVTKFNELKTGIVQKVLDIKTAVVGKFNEMVNWIKQLPATLMTIGKNMFTSMKNGISSTIGNIASAIKSGINNAISFLRNLPSQMLGYGRDMIQGMIDGITGMVGRIGSAVSGVADKIRSFLHFSVPDEGPLTDYESWMPDMLGTMAKGIDANKFKITDSIKRLTKDMSIGVKATGGVNSSTLAGTKNITNNYGSLLHTDKIEIKNDMSIEAIAQQLIFYMKQQNSAMGGN